MYVFVRKPFGWVLEARLMASDAQQFAHFGISVSLSGDTLLVGVDADDGAGNAAGAAYVYVRTESGWIEQTKLVASGVDELDFFGNPVDLDGDLAVIGAQLDENAAGAMTGSA